MDQPAPGRTGLTISLLLTLVLTLSCTGDSKDEPEPGTSAERSAETSTEPEARVVPLDGRVGAVAGVLPHARRRVVLNQVSTVVDRWFRAAYLAGDYPRSDFGDAFPGFTRGAARLAWADRRFMSNARIGAHVAKVTPLRRILRVDVLSPKGYPRAVTARFRLDFSTDGKVAKRFRVKGRLMLTKSRRGAWQVFAYDVRRTARPGGTR